MNGLMLHCGANHATREEVMNSHTPPRTDTHVPVPHGTLLTHLDRVISNGGMRIKSEAHALSHLDNRYFGLLELEWGSDDKGHSLIVGARNSHDKSFRYELAMGSKVFVCDNLSFTGDVQVARMHTRRVMDDLARLTADAFGKLRQLAAFQDRRIEHYKNTSMSTRRAHDLVIKAIDAKALPASKVPAVLKEWRDPRHPEFKGKNAWSFFNAFTEIYKTGSLELTHKRSQRLYGLIDANIGLTA